MYVKCPSGLTGEVRKLKGREANNLASRKLARRGETYDTILKGCWLSTNEPGPYESYGVRSGDNSIPWGKILVCDRFYILTAIRIATYGPEYHFKSKCGEMDGSGCENQFWWSVNLEKDFDVYDLPNESIQKIITKDNRFETTVDGVKYAFKLLTGDDERRSSKKLQESRDTLMTTALEARLIEIEGIDHRTKFASYLENLDLDIQLKLIEKFEEVDGGIDTDFEVECPRCGNIYEAPVPFEGEAFWMPRSQKLRSGKKSRKSKKRTMSTES